VASQRLISAPTDILRAVGVVVLITAAVVLIAPRRHYEAVRVIDYSGDPSPPPAPTRPTTSSRRLGCRTAGGQPAFGTRPRTRHNVAPGFISPADEYVGIEQSDGPAELWIRQQTHGGRVETQVPVNGQSWTMRYQPDKDLRSLAITEDGVTTVVAGIASFPTLTELASALE
jgi:hypothetical protein